MTPQQRSEPADREDSLHRTFSKCVLVPDDHCAPIVLEPSRENLAGRRALPAGQNNQRPGVSDAWIRAGRDPDAPIIILGLPHWPRVEKQSSERERFFQ